LFLLATSPTFPRPRGKFATHIRKICQGNAERSNAQLSIRENAQYFDEGSRLLREFNQAKINIELALEDQMENLTSKFSGPKGPGR
jgi:hypothetical protein